MWTDAGGELIKLSPDEQASLLELLSSVGADVSKEKPLAQLRLSNGGRCGDAYEIGRRTGAAPPVTRARQSVTGCRVPTLPDCCILAVSGLGKPGAASTRIAG